MVVPDTIWVRELAPKCPMRDRVISLVLGTLIVATVVYVAVIGDASLCYQVIGCPTVRHVVLGY
jgi:hypothetical protein